MQQMQRTFDHILIVSENTDSCEYRRPRALHSQWERKNLIMFMNDLQDHQQLPLYLGDAATCAV